MSTPPSSSPTLDPRAVQRWQGMNITQSPWLHEEVARRMQERLDYITLQPATWLHWQPVQGGLQAHELLARRYPDANVLVAQQPYLTRLTAKKHLNYPWWKRLLAQRSPRFDAPAASSVNMLWANMDLHMRSDPLATLAQWHAALAVDGYVMFSCLGPDTLLELRQLYQRLGWGAPAHEFTDMHDLGDMLVAVGFSEPVMDMERITLTFETPQRLLQELRGLGRNLHRERFGGLRGRAWLNQLHGALAEAPLQISFEIVYGHAFKAAPRLPVAPQTVLSLQQMRETLRQHKNNNQVP